MIRQNTKNKAMRLVREGLSATNAANQCNVSPGSVSRWIRHGKTVNVPVTRKHTQTKSPLEIKLEALEQENLVLKGKIFDLLTLCGENIQA